VPQIFFPFYTPGSWGSRPTPTTGAGAAGTESWASSGLANTVPPGDQGSGSTVDANLDDVFNF
jgi:hypothetical protein